jgi:outer membrane receptor for Fe3+-dicitrate
MGGHHTLKAGGDYQQYTIRTYQVSPLNLASQIARNDALAEGDPTKRTLEQIMIQDFWVNNYGYDVYGNANESDDFLGPRHPVFASGYIQDRMEFSDLVVNVGLRYDYINTAGYVPVDPTHPELTRDPYTNEIKPEGLRRTIPFHGVSPRLGMAYPISDATVFHVQYAKLIQQSELRDINVGLYSGALFTNTAAPIGFDLRPSRATQYEIGFTQQIGEFASFDVTGYYKDIKDQIVMRPVQTDRTSQYSSYGTYANGDFATTKGVEIVFAMRRYKRLLFNASLGFQDARGSGSFSNSNWGIIGAGTDTAFTPYYVSPLSYLNAVRGNVSIDYRFGRDDGGPVLSELGASLLLTFNSGHPYTRVSSNSDEFYARNRRPIEALNSSTTPWVYQADLRVDKTFRFGELLSATLSLYVINLFDTRNVLNVWERTGSAEDDGYLSNPGLSGAMIEKYGPRYADVYRLVNLSYMKPYGYFNDPYRYGPPRQIRLGLRLEY